jgi:hypothetical protein
VLAADIFCKLELLRWWWYIALGDLCQSFCSSQKEKKKKKKQTINFWRTTFVLSFHLYRRGAHMFRWFLHLHRIPQPYFAFLLPNCLNLNVTHSTLLSDFHSWQMVSPLQDPNWVWVFFCSNKSYGKVVPLFFCQCKNELQQQYSQIVALRIETSSNNLNPRPIVNDGHNFTLAFLLQTFCYLGVYHQSNMRGMDGGWIGNTPNSH